MNPTGAADVHHNAILAILHAEIRRSCTHQLERRGVVDGQHGFPLFIRHLKLSAIPSYKPAYACTQENPEYSVNISLIK